MDFTLTPEEKTALLRNARLAIASKLRKTEEPFPESTPRLREPCGAFVSLHIAGRLRGCIGLIVEQKPLWEAVKEMALCAAFSDPRFPPLKEDELDHVEIEISVLCPLRRITDIREIEVGRHGILVRQGFRSGLLLPQVATEYNWTREEFLSQTCRKAGLPPSSWQSGGVEIEIFSAEVFSERETNAG